MFVHYIFLKSLLIVGCFFASLSVVAIPQNLLHTSIIVGHWGSMISQIMLIWKDFCVTYSSVKVWALFSYLYFIFGMTHY